jgi:hypothetical protein
MQDCFFQVATAVIASLKLQHFEHFFHIQLHLMNLLSFFRCGWISNGNQRCSPWFYNIKHQSFLSTAPVKCIEEAYIYIRSKRILKYFTIWGQLCSKSDFIASIFLSDNHLFQIIRYFHFFQITWNYQSFFWCKISLTVNNASTFELKGYIFWWDWIL